jgi:hypothetical protein
MMAARRLVLSNLTCRADGFSLGHWEDALTNKVGLSATQGDKALIDQARAFASAIICPKPFTVPPQGNAWKLW